MEPEFEPHCADASISIVVILDREANIKAISKSILDVAGYEPPEVVGQNWFKTFLPEEDHEEIMEVFKEVWEGISLYTGNENPIVTKEGALLLIRWDNYVIKDENGKTLFIVSLGSDIT